MSFQYPENIVVASFMFCKKHGRELCHDFSCISDHRMTNNVVEDLDNVFQHEIERTGFSLDDRNPLNVYALGAVPVKPGSEDTCVASIVPKTVTNASTGLASSLARSWRKNGLRSGWRRGQSGSTGWIRPWVTPICQIPR
ncbi:hypothetical protein CERSUDRAFT_110632 [Gelatoporia subvermispora B]|uniref:Uncharacterized protein n=1 Tax=Ceriporiopsis subvermispora (strain B) TaxID=914234 RepID=M2QY68_CERS8|nr:hypothetical protein CERSUDRAFT_110632 [Gelatoporia subvermispora B]